MQAADPERDPLQRLLRRIAAPARPRAGRERLDEALAHRGDALVERPGVHASVGIGSSTVTRTVAARISQPSRGSTSRALCSTIGTIGARAAIAIQKPPFLNGPTS